MPDNLGKFAEGCASWRRMIASVPDVDVEAKSKVFTNAANDVAGYVAKGLDKALAVDELHDIAVAHGLVDARGEDTIQTTISDAFMRVEFEPWPDDAPRPAPRPRKAKAGNGWYVPGAIELPLPAIQSRGEFIMGFVPPNYLIDGVLQRRFIYSLTGQTGHAKTSVALLLAQLVAADNGNSMLGKHKVERGRVVYFVGENPDDVRMRVIGSASKRDDDPTRDNIWFIPGVFNIEQMIPVLVADTKVHGELSLIIIDTSAAYFLGDEEMSNTQMGAYARMLRRLTTLPGGPCVLVLCHPIKHALDASQLIPRGGGAYLNEMDGNLTLWRQDDLAILDHSAKFRGPGFQPITFRLERIEQAPGLTDIKGRYISTVHAVPITQTEEDAATDTVRSKEDHVLAAMLKNPDGSLAKWATDLGWVNARSEPDKKTVENCINRLKGNKPALIRKNRDRWELTDEGKTQGRKAALRFQHEQDVAALADAQKTLL